MRWLTWLAWLLWAPIAIAQSSTAVEQKLPASDLAFVGAMTRDVVEASRVKPGSNGGGQEMPRHGAPWEVFGPHGQARQNAVYMASVAVPYSVLRDFH